MCDELARNLEMRRKKPEMEKISVFEFRGHNGHCNRNLPKLHLQPGHSLSIYYAGVFEARHCPPWFVMQSEIMPCFTSIETRARSSSGLLSPFSFS